MGKGPRAVHPVLSVSVIPTFGGMIGVTRVMYSLVPCEGDIGCLSGVAWDWLSIDRLLHTSITALGTRHFLLYLLGTGETPPRRDTASRLVSSRMWVQSTRRLKISCASVKCVASDWVKWVGAEAHIYHLSGCLGANFNPSSHQNLQSPPRRHLRS